MLLICHKIPVRLLNHFIQHFFGGHHDFGQYFQAVCGFFRTVSAGRNHQHAHHAFFCCSRALFSSSRRTALCCLTLSAGKGLIVNFALFRLGLLFSKNCTCCSFQPSQLSNVAQANQYFCSGVRGFSGVPTHRTCMAFHNQSHCSLSLLSTHEKGRGNHCLCWPIQRILS